MKLPEHLITKLKAKESGLFITYLTTVSKEGKPNILPLPFSDVIQEELILFPDLFAQKTKVNLNENTKSIVSFIHEETNERVILEGITDIIQWGHPPKFKLFGLEAGEVLKKWGDWDETVEQVIEADETIRPSVFAQRGVIVFKPEKIIEA